VKEEDADWLIYHLIPADSPTTAAILKKKSGLDPVTVEDSLVRLERACLIQKNGEEVRILSFGEALIRNQVKYDKDLPYTIENGVIKARKQ
jgi:hypothetical protein